MPDLAALVRGRTTWAVVGAVLVVGVAQGAVGRVGSVLEVAVYGVLPALALAAGITVALRRQHWTAVGGLVVGVPPAVLAGLVAGHRHAAIAVLAALVGTGVIWWRDSEPGLVLTTIAGLSVVAVALWFVSGSQRGGPKPDGETIVSTTGSSVRAAIGTVGDGVTLRTAVLLWVVAVGVVIGAGLMVGTRAVFVVPGAFVAFVVTAWLIEWFRGPVAPAGGAWILSGAVAGAAAAVDLSPRLDRAVGRLLVGTVGVVWASSLAHQARVADIHVVASAVAATAPAVLVGLVWVKSAADVGVRRRGVNVVGYFDRTSGLGERARMLSQVLRSAGIDVSEWSVTASVSPRRDDGDGDTARDQHVHDTTIAVVTALEFPALVSSHPDVIVDVERVIGYWFWELDTIPASHVDALGIVDEIWTPTRFVHDAYRRVAPCPVRLVPLPIAEPLAAPTAAAPRTSGPCTFVTSFDYLSVIERKNPQGVIAAFRRAFPAGDEPVRLIVKTLNADRAPGAAARLAGLSALDDRIEIRDGHLTDAGFHELIAAADAFVSLHRSEGLGLQPALAMWLGVPVICTAYSGVLDLVDEATAFLVPYTMTVVEHGGGAYPPGAQWADPDLDAAAEAMRRVAADPARARAVGAAARARMRAQPSVVATGRAVARVLAGRAADAVVDESWFGGAPAGFGSVGTMQTTTSDVSIAP